MKDIYAKAVNESNSVKLKTLKKHSKNLAKAALMISECLLGGRKILVFGNGGSAADSQHIAAEFVVRLKENRRAYPAIALTTDTSVLTSCGNDFSFEDIFARQVEALGKPGDICLAISTSGNSPNVLAGIKAARGKGLYIMGITGKGGGRMSGKCDLLIDMQSKNTMRIQEAYMTFLHTVCESVEKKLEGLG
ncbi:MAG TPA: D-sedoheptulose 7-phosphate isomerase [Candidatus Goldiibacteriota bacterium]|nr:D-sedoheptulose 7-phosphate isomerase [Candidatus Goldiibacteriota bacterium]